MAKKKVCVITGSRADYGLLKPLSWRLKEDPEIDFSLLITGSHLLEEFGFSLKAIIEDGFDTSHQIPILSDCKSELKMSQATGIVTQKAAQKLHAIQPDCVVLLGDRYEILGAATAALLLRIPIAHIHGGEITEGAIDESIRHAITKMSHIHFVTTQEHKRRVEQLGEDPQHVFCVGAPALDLIASTPPLSLLDLSKSIEFDLSPKFFLITLHPETLGETSVKTMFTEVCAALTNFNDFKVLWTNSNADTGGAQLNELLAGLPKKFPQQHFVVGSLGSERYYSAIDNCSAVIGNSSSGLIEVPYFKKPTINLGIRQKGRLRGPSVIDANFDCHQISQAIEKALSQSFSNQLDGQSPYGAPGAAQKMHQLIKDMKWKLAPPKPFFDL